MPFLGMFPTAKRVPIAHHRLVFCREHPALGATDGFHSIERFYTRQARGRASAALVHHIPNDPEDNNNPKQ
ncbi:hypothetical protein Hneap_2271 [Halothiobacillus neapolitanus c2]|uniref:Uncharacterized protein n=1 Tax=Halothiobacillus neapolitanus (strain ATCC 23641 / DSM 15147 / CIP 104769 / NCIMB 8539 / c2) TaxID=555778 RepID=D0KWW5_HALNC|nr:hypothetical protein [Halothiobacillus neapolitanus]ACX97085.1 hypothetical protein Hneap_2271 [Halothiobacillus neapolitanus c2]TDN58045.1 hypothetical protein C8D83_10922 [Halothiobacillus neapolitanus]